MIAIPAIVRGALRMAVSAALTMAVLLAGLGAHPVTHCQDHDCTPGSPAAVDLDEPDNDDDGLCLTCDCSCQTINADETFTLLLPESEVLDLEHADRPKSPDDVVLEVEPPPDRMS